MAKHIINAGATSQRFYIYLQDSTTGQGETGVTSATCYYLRDSVSGAMPTAVTLTFGAVFASPGTYPAWSSGQVREIGYMPGIYLVDLPDAIFANTARNAVVQIVPTTGTPWLPVNLEFTLSAVSLFDSVRMGMTALPNFTAGAIGGLPLSVNAAGGVNTVQLGGTAQTGRDIGASVLLSSGTGAGQVNLSAGRVGINWADVINPTTALSLTGTTISTSQQIASVTGSVNSVTTGVTVATNNDKTNYGLASGAISTATFSAGAINAAAIADGAIDAGAIAADAITSAKIADSAITIRLDTDGTASEARLITGTIASDVYNAPLASYTLPNTFGSSLVRTRSTSPSNEVTITGSFHIACDVHELQPAVIDNTHFADSTLVIGSAAGTGVKIYLDANSITAGVIANNAIDAAAIATDADEAIADAILNRNIAGGGNGTGATTDRTVRSALRALRNKSEIVGSTLTVYTENDAGTAWTASVTTNASANPVTGIDPAGP